MAHGLAESAPSPEYPFLALANTPLWELDNLQAPPAHGSAVLPWLNAADPMGGLTQPAHELVAADDVARADAVGVLLNRYFASEPADELLGAVGLYSAKAGPPSGWDLRVGDVARRQVIHKRFGGQRQGGISTPANTKLVLLWPNSTGSSHGYDYDGWKTDGSYHYTGQGRFGDQRFTPNNQALLEPGNEIHILEEAADTVVRYVGQFRPDDNEPFYLADAPDSSQELRSAIVFRLWPADGAIQPRQPAPVADQTTAVKVPLEAHNVRTFTTNRTIGSAEAARREADLVQRYSDWLAANGMSAVGYSMGPAGQPRRFRADLYNETTRELVEAKGNTSRDYVRLALGQILDYSRFVVHDSLAILVPVRPAEDLVDLLALHGVTCIYETEQGGFERSDD